MRLFFAVPLGDAARAAAAALVEGLAGTGADYKWVEAENLHVTLAFLGETPPERLPELEAALARAAAGKPAFELVFDRLGAFSSLERPKMLWLGPSRGAEELAALAAPLTPPNEPHPFRPHLTLGRQRTPRGLPRLREELAKLGSVRIEDRVDRIALIRSRLSGKGPAYEELARARLAS